MRWVAKSGPTTALAVYSSLTKTAEAVEALSGAVNTQLKRELMRGLVEAKHIPISEY